MNVRVETPREFRYFGAVEIANPLAHGFDEGTLVLMTGDILVVAFAPAGWIAITNTDQE